MFKLELQRFLMVHVDSQFRRRTPPELVLEI